MKKLIGYLSKIMSAGMLISLSILVAVTFLQVLCRFVFKVPVSWSDEVARISFVWLIMLGAALGVKDSSHLSLDVLATALPESKRYLMRIGTQVVIIAISLFLLTGGGSYVIRSLSKRAVTLPIPANFVYISMPICAALMILFAVDNIMEEIKVRRGS